jgi:hypothetical protein
MTTFVVFIVTKQDAVQLHPERENKINLVCEQLYCERVAGEL